MAAPTDPENMSVDDMFALLESNKTHVVQEIQRIIHDKLTGSKDSGWLVTGLYEYYSSTQSMNGLKLLLNVKEPLDTVLCDRIYEGLRSSDTQNRILAVNMLGFIARKQPTWVHKLPQTFCFKELIKMLKHEVDLVLLVTGLLVLLTLLPAVPSRVSTVLTEIFEVFSRLAAFLHVQNSGKSVQSSVVQGSKGVSVVHLHVAIYAFFNRLYGMFPCNFLSWLRTQYSETGKDYAVFTEVVAPLLSTVRMHPLLVTQSKDHERSAARWKGLGEVHDVLAECSRYSLNVEECGYKDEPILSSILELPLSPAAPGCVLDPTWTPGKFFDISSPAARPTLEKIRPSPLSTSRFVQSPPEAAIEATPENTPYATPVKEENMRLQRQPVSANAIRSLMRSPTTSPTKNTISPFKELKDFSPLRWQSEQNELRRSSNLNKQDIDDTRRGYGEKDFLGLPRFTKDSPQSSRTGATEETDEDTEVSSLTNSNQLRNLDTRHITPHIFPDSAGRLGRLG
ncbi:hamartin [Eurytemora carolleeae]|uniref:hamartin n=1 Tax=Eurytemora carolleeae TaxID=1294199 RepID=UPI000C78A3E9|nr:hamartin [Eurytemora carolleeae]|eukprot:XP_023344755.1 hamartin-like [Eurytemora affinis]